MLTQPVSHALPPQLSADIWELLDANFALLQLAQPQLLFAQLAMLGPDIKPLHQAVVPHALHAHTALPLPPATSPTALVAQMPLPVLPFAISAPQEQTPPPPPQLLVSTPLALLLTVPLLVAISLVLVPTAVLAVMVTGVPVLPHAQLA